MPDFRPPSRLSKPNFLSFIIINFRPPSERLGTESITSTNVEFGLFFKNSKTSFWIVVKLFWIVFSSFWIVFSSFWIVFSSFWIVRQMIVLN